MFVPSDNQGGAYCAQLIADELPKIGIGVELLFLSQGELLTHMMWSLNHEDYVDGSFDIGFMDWMLSPLEGPAKLFELFHSSQINPLASPLSYYPVNNQTLDGILEHIMNPTYSESRKEYVRQALEMLVWEIHPMTGIYQQELNYYLQKNIIGFTPYLFEEMYFENGKSNGHGQVNHFVMAGTSPTKNYNPILAQTRYDRLVSESAFSGLVEQLVKVPGMLTRLPYPVAVKNNYTGEISSLDSNLATVWEIELRDNVYWHEGYGYRMDNTTHRDILRVDSDDIVWFYQLCIKNDSPPHIAQKKYQYAFGTQPEKAIVKVDNNHVQFHLKTLYADLFTLFNIILPRHILDPSYDALGLGPGIRADRTSASSYADWKTDDFNLGKRTSGDLERPATIGTGAYMIYPGHPGKFPTNQSVELTKWNHYFKDNDTFYWKQRVKNRFDKYIYTWSFNKDTAFIALENGTIDLMDSALLDQVLQAGGYLPEWHFCKTKPFNYRTWLDWDFQTLCYNILNGTGSKLANKWVRLAISHMIPRQKIVDYFLGGLGTPNCVPFPRQSPLWPENLESFDYSLTKALKFMEKAGYDVSSFIHTQPTSGFFLVGTLVSLVVVCIYSVRIKRINRINSI